MSVDHSHQEDPIEQLLLTAYRNPERKGCPGRDVLAELANKQRDPNDATWYHLWHCSPCYSEFKELRDARWEREQVQERSRKRRLWAAAAALVLALGAGGGFWFFHEHNNVPHVEVAQITLNLFDVDASRGIGENHAVNLSPLPRKIDDVHIILPRFSAVGQYTIAILKSKAADSAVVVADAPAVRNGNRLNVSVRLDLSSVAPGTYLLGTRLHNGDQIYFYPLTVK